MKRSRPFPILPAGSSLAGLLFCLWVWHTGGESLCLSNGCALFQNFALAGISLWQAGIAVFSTLFLLCLFRLVPAAVLLAALCLAADTALLGVMLFTAPCTNCLIVGALLAFCFFSLRRQHAAPRSHSPLLTLWGLLFLFASGGILHDLAEPWSPLPGEGPGAVHVYFSPSCRACQQLLEQADQLEDARWFPVQENDRDLWIIHEMERRLAQGKTLPQSLQEALASAPSSIDLKENRTLRISQLKPAMLKLQFRLWKNHARVLASGSDRLPLVQFLGLPAFLRHDAEPPTTPHHTSESTSGAAVQETADLPESLPSLSEQGTEPFDPSLLGVAGFCGGEDQEKNCTNAAPPRHSLEDVMAGSGLAP